MSTNFTGPAREAARPKAGTKFYLALLEFLMSAKQHLVAIGARHDLTSIQAVTLLLLDEHAPRPMKNLCALFHCDASNVTGIIDGLEQKGLVERRSDAHDRRVKTVSICPAGKRLQQHIIGELTRDDSYLFDPLTPHEAEELVRIIEKLAPADLAAATVRPE